MRTSRGCVAFSPDGKTVAAACASIRLYDVTTGEERLRIDRKASDLHFTDDGKTLTAAVDGAIYRWDTATGKTLTPEAGDSGVAQILVSADGSRVVTRGQDGDAHIWDGTTGKHLRRFQAGWQRGMAISPDGRFLAWPVEDYECHFADPQEPGSPTYGSRIRFYDIAAGKVVDRIPTFKGDAQDLAFTNDGKRLVTAEGHGGMVRIWNVETGEGRAELPGRAGGREEAVVLRSADAAFPGRQDGGEDLRAEPGRAVRRSWSALLISFTSGTWPPEKNCPASTAATPSTGRFRPTADSSSPGREFRLRGRHRRAASRPCPTTCTSGPPPFRATAAFWRPPFPEARIQIWEVATWTKRNEFKGHRDRPTTLTFAPNGQLLSGSLDTTVLAWDMRPPRVAASVTLESAWDDLAKREAAESFRSEGRFLAAPADAVKFFAEKIKPVEALDPRRVRALARRSRQQRIRRSRGGVESTCRTG